MSTPESLVKRKVSALLKLHKCYYEMPVPSGFGKSGLDYTGCAKGTFFAIETKSGNKPMTPRQMQTASAIHAAGGKVFLVTAEAGFEDLKTWLEGV
jgi:penicillin-binding protein-related factor A (putative recombinase)